MMLLPEISVFIWLLLNVAVISFFCVGWRTITDERKIFYFLRKPFDMIEERAKERLERNTDIINAHFSDLITNSDSDIELIELVHKEWQQANKEAQIRNNRNTKIKQELLKPIIGCVTCFASFWGSTIYWSLNLLISPYMPELWAFWPVVCISSAFVNQYLWTKISE